ncbi:MAG: polysaccharide export protein, partial [Bilophila sp.]
RFQDGDTIVVGEKGPSVVASGEIRNTARFEFKKENVTGAALADLADPQSRASHVSLIGSRNGAPYNLYLPLREFRTLRLESGDQVRFLADTPGDTIMIEAQGAIRGASRFPVRRNARLRDIQSYIAVEPDRANLGGLYIKRKSVAVRQKKAIEDALRRLEQNAYTATSASSDEAQIRSKEAEMLSNFISRARDVQPEGVVVVGTKGNIADLALEDGDIIVIPEKTDVVLISGEVMMPQAIVWNKNKDLNDYIRGAGGFSNRADTSNLLVLRPSGEVFPNTSQIEPGDQVLILPRVESKSLQAVKDISQVLYQVAVACKVILDI